jgi:hypothetical protein
MKTILKDIWKKTYKNVSTKLESSFKVNIFRQPFKILQLLPQCYKAKNET